MAKTVRVTTTRNVRATRKGAGSTKPTTGKVRTYQVLPSPVASKVPAKALMAGYQAGNVPSCLRAQGIAGIRHVSPVQGRVRYTGCVCPVCKPTQAIKANYLHGTGNTARVSAYAARGYVVPANNGVPMVPAATKPVTTVKRGQAGWLQQALAIQATLCPPMHS